MSDGLRARFASFLATQIPPLEPDFVTVADWAIHALRPRSTLSEADARTLIAQHGRARDAKDIFTKVERCNARTSDVAMREALRLLRQCLGVQVWEGVTVCSGGT